MHMSRNEMKSFVAFDVETTGLSAEDNDIIEIGLVRFEKGKLAKEYSSLIRPSRKINDYVVNMTGITNEMVADAPCFHEIAQEILQFIGDRFIVGHNIQFDLGMLNAALMKNGFSPVENPHIDTLDLASLLMPTERSYKLGHLAKLFGIEEKNVHRAKDDAIMTSRLYLTLFDKILQLSPDIVSFISYYAESVNWSLMSILKNSFPKQTGGEEFPWILLFTERLGLMNPDKAGTEKNSGLARDADPVDLGAMFRYFDQDGRLGVTMKHYERRTSQIDMLEHVWSGLSDGLHQVVEAGTGVGKSFAYLIPAMNYAVKTSAPVVISTRTKTLQEQLIDKDIPFLKTALNIPVDYVMVKGRENYLCMNKLAYVFARIIQEKNKEDMVGVLSIMLWLLASESGDFSEIHNSLVTRFKGQVYSDSHSCLGNKCPFKTICFLNRIKKRAKSAHILIVNHALLFSDVFYEANILPDFHHLIIDEAHAIEDVATQCFSRTLSRKRIHEVAVKLVEQRLWEGKSTFDPLVAGKLRSLQVTSRAWLELNMEYFEKIESIFKEKEKENYFFKKSQKKISFKQLSSDEQTSLDGLMEEMDRLLGEIALMLEDAGAEVKAQVSKVQYAFYRKIQLEVLYIREDLNFLRQNNENTVRWIDAVEMKRSRHFELKAVPIDVGADLQKYVFAGKRSVMLTSATLSVKNNFNYFLSRIGYLDTDRKIETFSLPSPFDLEKSILLCAPHDTPIYEDTREYVQKLSEYIEKILLTTQGKALVLFTSHKHLNDVYFQIKDSLQHHKIPVYCQGRKVSDRNIIKQFRENVNSVLMGTDSFWEGLDVPGESLSHVIIVKLPFDVPTDPIVMARMEQVGLKGKSSFFDYVIPNAVTRFKQGFGRLIRSKTDKGSVMILDRRVLTQGYGKSFLQSVVANRQFPPNIEALRNLLMEWF